MNVTSSTPVCRQTQRPELSIPRNGSSLRKPRMVVLWMAVAATSLAAVAEPGIRVLKGANRQTAYGAAFPLPLAVWVSDPVAQHPLAGVKVAFVAGPGIGLSSDHAITDEQGLAAVNATGLAAGTSVVQAGIAGFPASNVQFDNLVVQKATLTVVPSDLKSAATQEAALSNGPQGEAPEVRPASIYLDSASSLQEPAFLAGLRGGSGVFVQTAIWQAAAKPSGLWQAAPVRNAIEPKAAAPSAPSPAAPVRRAVVETSPISKPTQISNAPVRAAVRIKTVAASAAPISSNSVRAVRLDSSAASAAGAASYLAGTAIRRAFYPSGTN